MGVHPPGTFFRYDVIEYSDRSITELLASIYIYIFLTNTCYTDLSFMNVTNIVVQIFSDILLLLFMGLLSSDEHKSV